MSFIINLFSLVCCLSGFLSDSPWTESFFKKDSLHASLVRTQVDWPRRTGMTKTGTWESRL